MKKWREHLATIYLSGTIGLGALGLLLAIVFYLNKNSFLTFIGVLMVAGAVLCLMGWSDARHVKAYKKYDEIPNCVFLTQRAIEFIHVETAKLLGLPWRCINDGTDYHVHKLNGKGEHEEFALPDDDDSQYYYNPREYANVVTMPSNKKYFTWSMTGIQKLSVLGLGIIIVVELVALIAISG